jgi:hypothetical protein
LNKPNPHQPPFSFIHADTVMLSKDAGVYFFTCRPASIHCLYPLESDVPKIN